MYILLIFLLVTLISLNSKILNKIIPNMLVIIHLLYEFFKHLKRYIIFYTHKCVLKLKA